MQKLSILLPVAFVLHYLQFNGGITEKSWWNSLSHWEGADFKPFIYNSMTNNAPCSLINGCYTNMLDREVTPKKLLHFAND